MGRKHKRKINFGTETWEEKLRRNKIFIMVDF